MRHPTALLMDNRVDGACEIFGDCRAEFAGKLQEPKPLSSEALGMMFSAARICARMFGSFAKCEGPLLA